MQKILTINEIKVYSRKEIVAWVQSTNTSPFQELKNGLFFIKILHKLVPHDIARCKVVQKPINQYQQTQNMNIVKKVLNKHNLQLNMNVQAIVLSKNCFQLANWFKNLYEQNKSDKDTDFHYSEKSHTPSKIVEEISRISNYKSLSRATSSDKKGSNFQTNNIKKLGRVTSGFIGMTKTQKFSYTIKVPKDFFESELTYQLFSNSRQAQKQKTNERSRTLKTQQLRHAKSKSKYPNNNSINFFNSSFVDKEKQHKKSKPTEEETIANLMKQQALEQQIAGIEKILSNISQYVNKSQLITSVDKLRKQIISIIYKIPVLSISEQEKENNCSENK